MIYYIADTHFGHQNIIEYCNRPFGSVGHMDSTMAEAIRRVDTAQNRLIHAGDFAFGLKAFYKEYGRLQYPENNVMLYGNHDKFRLADVALLGTWFAHTIGEFRSWRTTTWQLDDKLPKQPVRVLVSHYPQRDLQGCVYNVYGYFHNKLFLQPERDECKEWLDILTDDRYVNAGAEITGYMPMTLPQLIEANEEARTRVW